MPDTDFSNVDPRALLAALMSDGGDDDAAAKTAALRGQGMQGSLLQATGDPGLAAMGKGVASAASTGLTTEERYGPESRRMRLMLGLTNAGARLTQQEGKDAASGERSAARIEAAATEADKARGFRGAEAEKDRVFRGEQGAADRASRESIAESSAAARWADIAARRAMAAEEKSARGGKPKSLGFKDRITLGNMASEIHAMDALIGSFRPEYAGGGPLGTLQAGVAQAAGGLGTRGMQEKTAWWADFNRLVDLPQRHALFGSALTPTEKASWESAKTIKPGTDPALLQRKLAEMMQIKKNVLQRLGDSMMEDEFDPEIISALTGGLIGGAQKPKAPPPGRPAPQPAPPSGPAPAAGGGSPKRVKVDANGNVIG